MDDEKNEGTMDFKKLAEKGVGGKSAKAATIILLLICVALTVSIIIKLFSSIDDITITERVADASTTVNVSASPATYGTFSKISRLNGEIVREGNYISIYPEITSNGVVTAILINKGDIIEAGDVIAFIDQTRPGQSYQPSPVTAKSNGIVSDVIVSAGEIVSASTEIATLTNNDDLMITASVPEKFLGTLAKGMVSTFESVAYPGRIYEGVLTYIAPHLDRTSRTADIEIEIIGNREGLMDGMYVKLNLETEHLENVMMVPTAAISTYLGDNVVYKVVDGEAVRTIVTVGSDNGDETVITSGLEEGDLVITAGNITNGSKVFVI